MKNKRTIIIISILIVAVIVYLLFFKKRKPESWKKGSIAIDVDNKNIPSIFVCKRQIIGFQDMYKIIPRDPERGEKFNEQFPLMYGDCGLPVSQIQEHLIKIGYLKNSSDADGKFGKKTENALNEYYRKQNKPLSGKFTANQFELMMTGGQI